MWPACPQVTALTDSNPLWCGTTKRVFDQVNGVASGTYSYLDTFRNTTSENYNSLQASVRKQSSHWNMSGTPTSRLLTRLQRTWTTCRASGNVTPRSYLTTPNLFYAPST